MRVFSINTEETLVLNDLNENRVEQTNKSNPSFLLSKCIRYSCDAAILALKSKIGRLIEVPGKHQ